MSTMAPALVKQLAKDWEAKTGLKSAVCSGVIGDAAHASRGGYHIGRSFQSASNYSVTRPDDKPGNGPDDAAAAIDMTMSTADMKTCTTRLLKLFSNVNDPRRKYVNAFNGWLGSDGAKRYDVYGRKTGTATADHKWHVHLEIRRKYVNSAAAMKAILSALKGETVLAYLASIGASAALAAASTTTKAAVAPAFPGTLKRNDKQTLPDVNVKAWQTQMLKRGWSSLGAADGLFGPKLEAAVKRWQTSCGLSSDGVIGAKTWPTPWTRPLGS